MPKVSVKTVENAPVVAAGVETRALFDREGDPIHTHLHMLVPDARLTITGDPTDRLIYVWSGAVRAGTQRLAAGSGAIVEYRATLDLTAESKGAQLIAFHLQHRPPGEDRAGGHVHLLPSERVPRTEAVNGEHLGGALFADAACPTCRVWLHENGYFDGDDETEVHSHSEDEVIFIIEGRVRLGNKLFGPGTAIAVAANTKYGFSTGPDGMRFVNFRAASPTYTKGDDTRVVDEGTFWRGLLGELPYVDAASA